MSKYTPEQVIAILRSGEWKDPRARDRYLSDADFVEVLDNDTQVGEFVDNALAKMMGDKTDDEFLEDLESRFTPSLVGGVVKCIECFALVEDSGGEDRVAHAGAHVAELWALDELSDRIHQLAAKIGHS